CGPCGARAAVTLLPGCDVGPVTGHWPGATASGVRDLPRVLAAPEGRLVGVPRRRRRAARRRGGGGALRAPRRPPGLDRRLDLPLPERAHPGLRPGRRGARPVPLPRAVAGAPRTT